jgi:hypothetical protein
MATATGLTALHSHLQKCQACQNDFSTLSQSAKKAILLFCKTRQLQKLVHALESKEISADFLKNRQLKAVLKETLLRHQMDPQVLGKCNTIVAHFFASQ